MFKQFIYLKRRVFNQLQGDLPLPAPLMDLDAKPQKSLFHNLLHKIVGFRKASSTSSTTGSAALDPEGWRSIDP